MRRLRKEGRVYHFFTINHMAGDELITDMMVLLKPKGEYVFYLNLILIIRLQDKYNIPIYRIGYRDLKSYLIYPRVHK